ESAQTTIGAISTTRLAQWKAGIEIVAASATAHGWAGWAQRSRDVQAAGEPSPTTPSEPTTRRTAAATSRTGSGVGIGLPTCRVDAPASFTIHVLQRPIHGSVITNATTRAYRNGPGRRTARIGESFASVPGTVIAEAPRIPATMPAARTRLTWPLASSKAMSG